MKIHRMDQGSDEWLYARLGIPTASEFNSLITPKGTIREGTMPITYLMKKLAEKWTGKPLPSGASTKAMDNGKEFEKEARDLFTLETGIELEQVGFIERDDELAGCSPDGWREPRGAEIKCPFPQTHLAYLLGGCVPEEYVAQVQGSMYVTGAENWHFMSYCRGFPPLIVEVKRDQRFIDNLEIALCAHAELLRSRWVNLVRCNGGKEPKRPAYTVKGNTATLDGVAENELDAYTGVNQ